MLRFWGPRLWYFIHTVAYNYPENPSQLYKENYFKFFNDYVPFLIPCDYCKHHYIQYKEKDNIRNYLNNKYDLLQWTINVHNDVNRQNGIRKYYLDECLYLYSEVNHKKLFQLLHYYYIRSTQSPYNYNRFKSFIQYLSIFFPCDKCRQKLINIFSNVSDYKTINNIVTKIMHSNSCLDF